MKGSVSGLATIKAAGDGTANTTMAVPDFTAPFFLGLCVAAWLTLEATPELAVWNIICIR